MHTFSYHKSIAIVLILAIAHFFTFCKTKVYKIWFYNNSDITTMYGVLDTHCQDGKITQGSMINLFEKGGANFNQRSFHSSHSFENIIKDSVVIYLIDSRNNHLPIEYIRPATISVINNECTILAEYHIPLTGLRALDWSFSFPPDERMKEVGVITTPSYEELRALYGN